MSSIEQNAPVGRDVRTTALDALRAVLDLAATEPDDGVAIRTGVDPTLRFRGLTWGELRRVVADAKSEAIDEAVIALNAATEWLDGQQLAEDAFLRGMANAVAILQASTIRARHGGAR